MDKNITQIHFLKNAKQTTSCSTMFSTSIFDAGTILNPCWQALLHFIFWTLLFIPIFFNIGCLLGVTGSVSNVHLRHRRPVALLAALVIRGLLALALVTTYFLELLKLDSGNYSLVFVSPSYVESVMLAIAVACYVASILMDCLIIVQGYKSSGASDTSFPNLLSMLALTTQAVLCVPIVALHVLDFRSIITNNLSLFDDVSTIIVFGLQIAFLLDSIILLVLRRVYLKEISRHDQDRSNLLKNDEQEQDFAASVSHVEQGLAAGFLSSLLLLWVNPLIQLGSSSSTKLASTQQLFKLPELITSNRGELEVFNKRLEQVSSSKTERKSRIFLLRALFSLYGWRWIGLAVLETIIDLIQLVPPLMLNGLLTFIERRQQHSADEADDFNPNAGMYYAAGMVSTSFLYGIFITHCYFQIEQLKLRVSSACMDMVYAKIMRVRACEFSNTNDKDDDDENGMQQQLSSSQVMNLIGTDCLRVASSTMHLHYFWTMPIFVAVTLYLLYLQVGWAFAGGLGLALLLIPINYFLTVRVSTFFERQMSAQDGRVKLLSECLSAIRTIKLHVWEPYFQARLQRMRGREMHAWKRIKYLNACCGYFWEASPALTMVITFVLYVLVGEHTLTAAKVFTTISIFRILMVPINVMPWVIKSVAESWVSVKRLQKYLSLADIDTTKYYDETSGVKASGSILHVKDCSFGYKSTLCSGAANDAFTLSEQQKRNTVNIVNAPAVVEQSTKSLQQFCLQNVTFDIRPGELIGVVGAVGSGKTSLLMAIMAEMHRLQQTGADSERFVIDADVLRDGFGVVLQEAWIQQGTVKENILCRTSAGVKNKNILMLKIDNDKDNNDAGQQQQQFYDNVVDACALRYEVIQALPRGDATDIGEQGVTLSGGQRARIALARACFANKSLVLLDDPLAAVDAQVGRHIFDSCIRGLLRTKTVVLVTHHVEYLRTAADRVIVMRNGKIDKFGPPDEVLVGDDVQQMLTAVMFARQKSVESTRSPRLSSTGRADSEPGVGVDVVDGEVMQAAPVTPQPQLAAPNLIDEEEREYGVVKSAVWAQYCRAVGWHFVVGMLVTLVAYQAAIVGMDFWLATWASHSEANNNATSAQQQQDDTWFYLRGYIGIAAGHSVLALILAFTFAVCSLRGGRRMHNMLLNLLLSGTQRFYDSTPSGRLINRYGSDLSTIDDDLPNSVMSFTTEVYDVLGTLTMICIGIPWFMLAILPALTWYIYIQNLYRKTSREVERILTLTRSPMYSWFNESLKGLTYIRAMRLQHRFHVETFRTMLDAYFRARYTAEACAAWLNLRLQLFGGVFITLVVVLALTVPTQSVGAGLIGLTLAYSLSIVGLLQCVFENFIVAEQNMVAVERVMQYVNGGIEREQSGDDDADGILSVKQKPADSWPERGQIEFDGVKLCYAPGLPLALNDISLEIAAGEKIAFVGRTGAGKSSLLQALFRTVPLSGGRIIIDGIDISSIRLGDLRSRLAIIPQAPALFDATLRSNIDPLGRYDDAEGGDAAAAAANETIDDAIRQCMLEQVAERLGKNGTVGENGAMLSQGERQLVCLARALVMRARIICLDEATASVDVETDMRMQRVLRTSTAFAASTVLCIAHRIQTVRDYDRVAVLRDGRVVECDRPEELLKRRSSHFYQLANAHLNASA